MKTGPDGKCKATFRLTPVAIDLLSQLAKNLGLPRGGYLEVAIRDLAQQHGMMPSIENRVTTLPKIIAHSDT